MLVAGIIAFSFFITVSWQFFGPVQFGFFVEEVLGQRATATRRVAPLGQCPGDFADWPGNFVFVTVKTTAANHANRIKWLMQTWIPLALSIRGKNNESLVKSTRRSRTLLKALRAGRALRNSISSSPVSFGVYPRPVEDFTLYYGRGTNARQLSLHNASTDELEHLSRACDPAKFGRNTEAVLDESFRRAGKLDVDVFATKFDAERSGLLGRIKSDLLSGDEHNRHVEAELYKLNVYAKLLDLAKLLDEPDFLPKGGLIGFGLQYQYPIAVDLKKPFGSTMEYLKGSDAMIRRVCKELSLPIQLKVYTQDDRENVAVLTDHVIQFKESSWVDGYVFQELAREKGAIVLLNEDKGDSDGEDRDDCDDEDWSPDLEGMGGVSIQWITEMAQRNITRTAFVFHGNQPELDYCYGTMCLIAEVGPAGDRKTLHVRPTKSRDRK
ncbi:uncharacterized protein LOC129599675 [Paramacrobiotus metropolitanus]|uniref:uncharacterized protein LOC129599675 n=1 Tax=Paramacrobiotus metropolitanus TaxID=2943436 RepID=UPI002445F78C|nr:uncharacterized protein LOC129599675 [Paramacrobiotus metropolitanus]